MSDETPPGPSIRVRLSSDRRKQLEQYNELRRSGRVARALVIAELKDGSWQVLGQGFGPEDAPMALYAGLQGLDHAAKHVREPRPEPRIEPIQRGEHNRGKPNRKEITTDANGTLVPPAGENFISCGECHHTRWYVLNRNDDDLPARLACAHCGNEVTMVRSFHEAGTA